MAENRVTAEDGETGIVRSSVPGDARVTAEQGEVALLKNVVPGAFARVTAVMGEAAIWRASVTRPRSRAFWMD
jgi:hypothetical protein